MLVKAVDLLISSTAFSIENCCFLSSMTVRVVVIGQVRLRYLKKVIDPGEG
jgi:hypothetical protein